MIERARPAMLMLLDGTPFVWPAVLQPQKGSL
jgi:hypothetical protein